MKEFTKDPVGPCNPPVVKDNSALVELGELLESFCDWYQKGATKCKDTESPFLWRPSLGRPTVVGHIGNFRRFFHFVLLSDDFDSAEWKHVHDFFDWRVVKVEGLSFFLMGGFFS